MYKWKQSNTNEEFNKIKIKTSALQSLASRKKAAETKCLPTNSDDLIWPSQYDAVSSLSNRQLLHFSALRYGVPGILTGFVENGGLTGVLTTPSTSLAGEFFVADPSTFSEKTTLFFFFATAALSLLPFWGGFNAGSAFGTGAISGGFKEIWFEGFAFGFSETGFSGTLGFLIVPNVLRCLKLHKQICWFGIEHLRAKIRYTTTRVLSYHLGGGASLVFCFGASEIFLYFDFTDWVLFPVLNNRRNGEIKG